ncbi:Polyadenylate-binding protein-interacting protein 3 [Zea mays]|nr:Polyadenylate-binding protein-interacting protein 3 [Zea mays]
MVGLPVEVRVRDGSAYAGVLHTACVDAGYGVVLKKAKKIANGKGDVNLSLGSFVDTLVVCPDDLVQVIAKGLSLPLKGVCKPLDSNVVAASGSLKPQISHANDPKMSNKTKNMSPLMQAEKCTSVGQEKNTSVKRNGQDNGITTSLSSSTRHVGACLSNNWDSRSGSMVPKVDVITSSASAVPVVASGVKPSQPVNNSVAKIVTSSKTAAKEFKLNPSAKVFSPSFASSRQVLAAAAPVDTYYISHSAPEVPMGVPVYEPKSVSGVSPLSNKVYCSNLSPANYAISPQYVPSIMGHNASRLDPSRIGTPYHPMQVGATYTTPSPQPVMAGKFSPVVYVQPGPQDAMHGTTVGFQGWPCPLLLNSYQASMQKFQGNPPVYLAPPVMATGNLPLVVPSPASLVQPFEAIHPIMVPAASSMVPGKYM